MITINFTSGINNDSLQIGDLAYYVTPFLEGGFEQSIAEPSLIGRIAAITATSIDVEEVAGTAPYQGDFIMFAKDSSVNLSGLVGYYAEIKIKNDSTEKAEMFSIGSEVTVSSK